MLNIRIEYGLDKVKYHQRFSSLVEVRYTQEKILKFETKALLFGFEFALGQNNINSS
jgi:hypothetical protein